LKSTGPLRSTAGRSSSSDTKLEVGRAGEVLAAELLRKKKYDIVALNSKSKLGEIDIIARKGKMICFVEVKTRSSDEFGAGAEAVDFRKQKKIISLAQTFLLKNNYADCDIRFDVIDILISKGSSQIEHLEDAFQA
jgi:putative endonuclease